MDEIKRYEFEGRPLTLERRGTDWWANGDEVAAVLGYGRKNEVSRVFKRHEAEFLPSETCVVNLTPQVGQARSVRLYSLRGVEHLAILGRTETCIRFRRWVLDVLETLRSEEATALRAALYSLTERMKALEEKDGERDSIELELLYERVEDGRAIGARLASRAHHPRIKIRIRERAADLNDLRDMKRGQSRLFKAPVVKAKAGAA